MHVWEMVEDVFNIGFFTTKMATSRPSWIWFRKKMICTCTPSSVVFVPRKNEISSYMSEIWLRTHACTRTKIETKSISPRFGQSPMGANNKSSLEGKDGKGRSLSPLPSWSCNLQWYSQIFLSASTNSTFMYSCWSEEVAIVQIERPKAWLGFQDFG